MQSGVRQVYHSLEAYCVNYQRRAPFIQDLKWILLWSGPRGTALAWCRDWQMAGKLPVGLTLFPMTSFEIQDPGP